MRSAKLEENPMEPFKSTKSYHLPLDWMKVLVLVFCAVVIIVVCAL